MIEKEQAQLDMYLERREHCARRMKTMAGKIELRADGPLHQKPLRH